MLVGVQGTDIGRRGMGQVKQVWQGHHSDLSSFVLKECHSCASVAVVIIPDTKPLRENGCSQSLQQELKTAGYLTPTVKGRERMHACMLEE